jgi:hypothetical protein
VLLALATRSMILGLKTLRKQSSFRSKSCTSLPSAARSAIWGLKNLILGAKRSTLLPSAARYTICGLKL